MKKLSKLTFLAGVVVSAFLLTSCGFKFRKKEAIKKENLPKTVVILPVNNQTQDFAAPILIRYFLQREVKRKDYVIVMEPNDVDQYLRQMGITAGSQIDSSNIQNVGQFVRAEGILQTTLVDFRQEPGRYRTVIRAKFQFIETQNGRVLWTIDHEIEGKGLEKIPPKGTMMSEWTKELIRSVAKSPTGKLPRKLVRSALKTLPDR